MAGPINQARVQISKIFNGEPRTYTRFNLDQTADGEDMQVEINHSPEGEDEEVVRSFPDRRQCSYKNMGCAVLAIIILFSAGYLVGYVTHKKPKVEDGPHVSYQLKESEDEGSDPAERVATEINEPFLAWSNIVNALQNKLSSASYEETLRMFSEKNHEAGSKGDDDLAHKVLNEFQKLYMSPRFDVHYVKLQMKSSKPNEVYLGSEKIGNPQGYLAYSATGTVQGKAFYGNYGTREDLTLLTTFGLNFTGSVVLVRTGQISIAEKVANAADFGVAAVLIFQETSVSSEMNTELYGHVHLGTGDPYTPGFPSFNHTQFPPSKSSGLPEILAQTITADMAVKIFKKMGGQDVPASFKGDLWGLIKYTLGGQENVTVTVNNVLVDTKINNVFGVIKGYIDPDHYVVLGAQRDAFGEGFAKSTVGTCLLVELARAISDLVKAGLRPRRSIMFASWSAEDYGHVGSTEWLEGYMASLNQKAFTYISLDGTVSGVNEFKASASPLLYSLLKDTMNEVKSPLHEEMFLWKDFAGNDLAKTILKPMKMEDGAYPFLAFSGIPSISFRFVSNNSPDYKHFGTSLDTEANLNLATEQRLRKCLVAAAQVAGQMALRLVHDHILRLDVTSYIQVFRLNVMKMQRKIQQLSGSMKDLDPGYSSLKVMWLNEASSSYYRAASDLVQEIRDSDLEDSKCRDINDRIMRVEHNLLSPYVSPKDVPFRHIIFGSGDHTINALLKHLEDIKAKVEEADADFFRNQFALVTWTIKGCANDLTGNIWAVDNQID